MKILIQSAADLLQSLQQHFVNVKVKQLNLNDATNQRVFQKPQSLSHRPIDISFVVDASGSIGTPAFNQCLKFIGEVIETFYISPNAVRVSLVTYGSEAYEEHAFGFTKYLDKDSLKEAILSIPYTGGSTNTSGGIRYMMQKHYPEARSEVHRVAIVITDGQSNSMQETAAEASHARNAYNQVFAIGVGSSLSSEPEELFKIASDKSCVLNIDSYDTLHTIKESLISKTCNYSIKQFKEKHETFEAEVKKKIVVKGSIEPLQERHEKLVNELKKKGDYLEEVKIVGEDAMRMLGRTTSGLQSGLDDIARDIDWLNCSFKTSTEQSNEEDPQCSAVKQKYLEAASAKTRGTVDNLCRTTDELVKRLKDIAKEISGKITHTSKIITELQEILEEICRELENKQRPVQEIRKGLAWTGIAAAVAVATATVVTGGLAAPLVIPLGVAAVGSFAGTQAVMKYMERDAFKKAQTQWKCYGRKLNESGLLRIIGQELINDSLRNEYIVNAGKAFKEMHKDYANSEKIAKKYFKDRMVAYFIFSGLDFIEFLKWLLSLTESMESHINDFINKELAGILRALEKMATDIDRK